MFTNRDLTKDESTMYLLTGILPKDFRFMPSCSSCRFGIPISEHKLDHSLAKKVADKVFRQLKKGGK